MVNGMGMVKCFAGIPLFQDLPFRIRRYTKQNNYRRLDKLLSSPKAIKSITNADIGPALTIACIEGYSMCVSSLLKAFPSAADWQDESDRTPLHAASYYGHGECIRELLEMNAKINVRDSLKRTPLMIACANGHHECVQLLIERGADITMTDAEGRTCLMLACAFDRYNAISALFGAESLDPDIADSKGFTALHFSAQYNMPLSMRVLLDGGAAVDCVDAEGNTPLMLACQGGYRRCTALLLEREASVNTANAANLKTALHLASQYGHTDCVDILMDFGADANMADNSGLTALKLSKTPRINEIIQLKSPGKPVSLKPMDIAEIASPSKSISIRD